MWNNMQPVYFDGVVQQSTAFAYKVAGFPLCRLCNQGQIGF